MTATTEAGKAEAELIEKAEVAARQAYIRGGVDSLHQHVAKAVLSSIGLPLSSLAWAASHAEEIRMLAEGRLPQWKATPELREKVARASHEAYWDHAWDSEPAIHKAAWYQQVDAALAVLGLCVAEGWQLVPIEPTEEMLDEGILAANKGTQYEGYLNGRNEIRRAYPAMLAAAPSDKEQGGG